MTRKLLAPASALVLRLKALFARERARAQADQGDRP